MPEVLVRVRNMLEVILLQKKLICQNDWLEQRVQARTAELREGYLETIFAMTRAAEYKDEDTGSHVQRIGFYSRVLACLLGMDKKFVNMIFIASLMHDIGKIGIPDHILLKPGGFTPDEWAIMKSHTEMGAKILGNSKSPYLKMGVKIALGHHERWDGSGYPYGKQGKQIPLAARILNSGDIYDALRTRRPYKPALDHPTAVKIITMGDGRTQPEHFDPVILAIFTQNHAAFQNIFQKVSGMHPTAAYSYSSLGDDPFSILT
jgi:putative two-component system response regulator